MIERPISLSTASFFPDTEAGFRAAAECGYDGVEVMVNFDKRSQTVESVLELSARYHVPIRSVHVPCLVITQHVWGWNPAAKLVKTVEMARAVDAAVVVVHPPFRWQRTYAASFVGLVAGLASGTGPRVTVENMYSVDALGRRVVPYRHTDDRTLAPFGALTFDTSHAAAAREDVLELYGAMGGRVQHLHLSDSTATRGDEHLPPGDGVLPLEELAHVMVDDGFAGDVVVEVGLGRLPVESRSAAAQSCLEFARTAFAPDGAKLPR